MQDMNVGRDTRGAAPRLLNLSTKQGEFQATDTHHWRRVTQQLLNVELVGPVWMVSRRDRSLTPAGNRTSIPRSCIPWRIYKADSCHPDCNWMHFALDVNAGGPCWKGLYLVAGRGVWEEEVNWISDFICTAVMTGVRWAQSVGCRVDGPGFDSHHGKRYLYSLSC
jgi:hypothetical protein